MKTIREWANDLPEDVRAKFLANAGSGVLDEKCSSLGDAISSAFFWMYSPEGLEFWKEVRVSCGRHIHHFAPSTPPASSIRPALAMAISHYEFDLATGDMTDGEREANEAGLVMLKAALAEVTP